jgi:hypothetical protein
MIIGINVAVFVLQVVWQHNVVEFGGSSGASAGD